MPTFDFAFDPAHRAAGMPFGVMPSTTRVDVADGELRVRFGPWRVTTPVSNIAAWNITGPFSFAKTAGPAHVSFADRGLTMATNGSSGVCLLFHEPVAGIDPFGVVRHPGLTLTVAEPEAFTTALEAARQTATTA